MTTQDIINVANEAYPDDLVKQTAGKGCFKNNDTLALFIVREIRSVTEGEVGNKRKLMLAWRAMRVAARELNNVAVALKKHSRDLEAVEKVECDREFGRTRKRSGNLESTVLGKLGY